MQRLVRHENTIHSREIDVTHMVEIRGFEHTLVHSVKSNDTIVSIFDASLQPPLTLQM